MSLVLPVDTSVTPCLQKQATFDTTHAAFSELVSHNERAWNGFDFEEEEDKQNKTHFRLEWHCAIERPLLLRMESDPWNLIQATPHPLSSAAHLAYSQHYGITLSPDMIWLCILQGFATHLKKFPKKYTTLHPSLDINSNSKTRISIRRDDFVRNSGNNPWHEAIGEFSAKISEHLGDGVSRLTEANFSTTTTTERVVSQIVMMDILAPFFDFDMTTLCGIPFFVIEGKESDWQAIHDRVSKFSEFGLEWWVKQLQYILLQFVNVFKSPILENEGSFFVENDDRKKFWNNFYKLQDMSGGPYVTGWINVLFPYITSTNGSSGSYYDPTEDDVEEEWESEKPGNFKENSAPGDQKPGNIPDVSADQPETDDEDKKGNTFVLNKKAINWKNDTQGGPTTGSFPSGLSKFPFTWFYYTTNIDMEIMGGFVGMSQNMHDEGLSLRPEIGYAIMEKESK
eukprot:Phypoly_transcript_09292.p1 GENE.Phypoly_transcript_09292~~Phypoly_transcript_09292.p1  ORF type:complete len:470 (+),score=84.72 Phypoly_transcript_09292:50-1411(+)